MRRGPDGSGLVVRPGLLASGGPPAPVTPRAKFVPHPSPSWCRDLAPARRGGGPGTSQRERARCRVQRDERARESRANSHAGGIEPDPGTPFRAGGGHGRRVAPGRPPRATTAIRHVSPTRRPHPEAGGGRRHRVVDGGPWQALEGDTETRRYSLMREPTMNVRGGAGFSPVEIAVPLED